MADEAVAEVMAAESVIAALWLAALPLAEAVGLGAGVDSPGLFLPHAKTAAVNITMQSNAKNFFINIFFRFRLRIFYHI